MKKKILSFLTYNYFAQKSLYYLGLFKLRIFYQKFYNFLFKNIKNNELNNLKIPKKGWSIIILTQTLNLDIVKKILQ